MLLGLGRGGPGSQRELIERTGGDKLLLEARAITDQVGTELPAGLTVPERDSLRALLHRFVADDPAVPRSAEPDGPAAGR